MCPFKDENKATGKAISGFTLLEVLVALSIISIVLISVIQLQGQSITMNETARFYSVAPFLAQAKMAEVQSEPDQFFGGDSGDFDEDFDGYSWQVETQTVEIQIDDKSPVAMVSATVTVQQASSGQKYRLAQYINADTEGEI